MRDQLTNMQTENSQVKKSITLHSDPSILQRFYQNSGEKPYHETNINGDILAPRPLKNLSFLFSLSTYVTTFVYQELQNVIFVIRFYRNQHPPSSTKLN